RSALGRSVALEPNGEQRLRHLREVCLVLETIAATEGLDYDAATAEVRKWIDAPAQLDPPHPVGADAVHVLTVHQAKGLEFPVVVLWDGCAQLRGPNEVVAWRTADDGRAWAVALDGFAWEEPRGAALKQVEKSYRDAERKRLVYVAATRARDLLVLPRAAAARAQHVVVPLTANPPPGTVAELAPYVDGIGAAWSAGIEPAPRYLPEKFTELDREVVRRWHDAAADAARPRFQPIGVTSLVVDEGSISAPSAARLGDEALDEDVEVVPPKSREGRFGAVFGETVHRAIARAVRDPRRAVGDIVREIAPLTGLDEHLGDAVRDVERAVAALRAASLLEDGVVRRFEYPVAAARDGRLLVGYVDFLADDGACLHVVDFKTDAPPRDAADVPAKYARQVMEYASLLRDAGLANGRQVRAGLLFTASDSIVWLAPGERS
ncbi:MAG: 3'-5' exonuclease, partial [Thermodesulfobacteriota bacterium]